MVTVLFTTTHLQGQKKNPASLKNVLIKSSEGADFFQSGHEYVCLFHIANGEMRNLHRTQWLS